MLQTCHLLDRGSVVGAMTTVRHFALTETTLCSILFTVYMKHLRKRMEQMTKQPIH